MASSHQESKMLMIVSALFLLPVLAMATARSIKHPGDENCWYELLVQTGNSTDAGTDSEVSVTLFDIHGREVEIRDLKKYGNYGPTWPNYFQKGNLDVFILRNTTCLKTEVCRIILQIEAIGTHPDWYCTEIDVLGTGMLFSRDFLVGRWLTPEQPEVIIDDCTGLRDGNAQTHTHSHTFFQSILRR